MEVIKDLKSLMQLINNPSGFIVVPLDSEGQFFLDYLKYSDFLSRVHCIATFRVAANNTAQALFEGVPIIPFEYLVHLREDVIFLVVGNEAHYNQLNSELTRYGCKKLFFLQKEAQVQVRQEIQRTVNSGQLIMWYLRHLDQEITHLSYAVHNQNELSETNTKAFGEFKNAFRGKDVVITGSGPTLKYYKPIPGAIHIGLNFTYRVEHVPLDYLVLVDLPRGSKAESEFIAEQDKVRAKVKHKIFIRQNKNIPGDPNSPSELLSCINDKVVRFFSGGRTLQNICHHSLNEVYNVAATAFHFALFTYPKRIFWVGCDSNFIGHFYDKPNSIKKDVTPNFTTITALTNYGAMKMFAKDHYPDTEIISINPVKLRGLFKDVYTEEYLKALEEEKKASEKLKEG